MLKFEKPNWLNKDLGSVNEWIGVNGKVEIEKVLKGKVYLRLIKSDYTYDVIPSSNALSELIIQNKTLLDEIYNSQVLELVGGDICVSQTISFYP